jgi:hypothetical protein
MGAADIGAANGFDAGAVVGNITGGRTVRGTPAGGGVAAGAEKILLKAAAALAAFTAVSAAEVGVMEPGFNR